MFGPGVDAPARFVETMTSQAKRPLISYHRGGTETHPSGTLAAYEAAISQGAEMIEFDVWQSVDGVLFCTHDEFDDQGYRIADRQWSEIVETYPQVVAYLDLLRMAKGRSRCHIDVKGPGYEQQIISEAFNELDDPATNAWFTTLDVSVARRLSEMAEGSVVALSLGRDMAGRSKAATVATRLGEIIPFYRLNSAGSNAVAVNERLLTRGLKFFCRLTGRKIMVWTVNDDGGLRRFLGDDAVDVLITDRPLRAAEIRDSR